MELHNDFTVSIPLEQAWVVLTDVERVAPCIPGAKLEQVEGEEYRGAVRLKVGPITVQYRGTARFAELDESARRAVLRAEGRETRGQGGATATIACLLAPAEGGTRIAIETDLTVTGRVAQFGRGVLAEVSNKLVQQFVGCLESTVLAAPEEAESDASSDAAPGAQDGGPGTPPPPSPDADEEGALPLLSLVGPALLKRFAPVVAAFGVMLFWRRWRRHRKSR